MLIEHGDINNFILQLLYILATLQYMYLPELPIYNHQWQHYSFQSLCKPAIKAKAIKKRTKKEAVSSIRCDSPTKFHMAEQPLQYTHNLQSQKFHLLLFPSMPITDEIRMFCMLLQVSLLLDFFFLFIAQGQKLLILLPAKRWTSISLTLNLSIGTPFFSSCVNKARGKIKERSLFVAGLAGTEEKRLGKLLLLLKYEYWITAFTCFVLFSLWCNFTKHQFLVLTSFS